MTTPDSRPLPDFLYGTAWKEDETRRLVLQALQAGFRGIDTANQRRHYHEAAVGEALAEAIAGGLVERKDVFLQTKFTHVGGQDHRLPYDPSAPQGDQVRQSFASSLEHLGVEHLDSYVLHGPTRNVGLGPEDLEAWAAMEELHAAGETTHLGVSNVNLDQLVELCERATVAPRFVQNRCFAQTGWDHAVRSWCTKHGLVYQGFSLLTANRFVLVDPRIEALAAEHGRTPAQVVFRFAQQVGMLPLTGTSSAEHARQDLSVGTFDLPDDALRTIERIAA